MANWVIIALLLRMSDNARRPVEEFHTGVLRITEDPDAPPRRRKKADEGPEDPADNSPVGNGPADNSPTDNGPADEAVTTNLSTRERTQGGER